MSEPPASRDWDELASRLGARAVADGEPTRWYEEIWSAGDRGDVALPWDRDVPYDLLAGWLQETAAEGAGLRAVVVGAGLGADAEHLAGLGYATTAFDISQTAVRAARERHPDSSVTYRVADLLALPDDLVGAFDLVVEIFTLQALHPSVRGAAEAGVRRLVAPGGALLAVQFVREPGTPVGEHPPWLLDRGEMEALAGDGLAMLSLETVAHPLRDDAPARWRAVLRRP